MDTLNVTISKRTAVDFLVAKRPSGAVVKELKMWLLKSLPDSFLKEGSELWWEREQLLADEDIKAGRVTKFENIDQMVKWLDD